MMGRGQARGVYTRAEQINCGRFMKRRRPGTGYQMNWERHSPGFDQAGCPNMDDLNIGYTAYPVETYSSSDYDSDFLAWAVWDN